MSFILKTLEKLLDRHTRDVALANRLLHRDPYMDINGAFGNTTLEYIVQASS